MSPHCWMCCWFIVFSACFCGLILAPLSLSWLSACWCVQTALHRPFHYSITMKFHQHLSSCFSCFATDGFPSHHVISVSSFCSFCSFCLYCFVAVHYSFEAGLVFMPLALSFEVLWCCCILLFSSTFNSVLTLSCFLHLSRVSFCLTHHSTSPLLPISCFLSVFFASSFISSPMKHTPCMLRSISFYASVASASRFLLSLFTSCHFLLKRPPPTFLYLHVCAC